MIKRNVVLVVMALALMLSVVAFAAAPAVLSGSDQQTSFDHLLSLRPNDNFVSVANCAPTCPNPGSDGG